MIAFFNFVLRLACAIVFGIILMFYNEQSTFIVKGIGLLFGLSGAFTLLNYLWKSVKGKQEVVPFSGYGSLLMSIMMFAKPDGLLEYVPMLLGFLLILDCSNQLVNLLSLRFKTRVKFAYYIAPIIVLVYGIFLLTRTQVDMLVGLSFLIYSLSEIVVCSVFFKYLFMNKTDKVENMPAGEDLSNGMKPEPDQPEDFC